VLKILVSGFGDGVSLDLCSFVTTCTALYIYPQALMYSKHKLEQKKASWRNKLEQKKASVANC